jgi:hypothetical protein
MQLKRYLSSIMMTIENEEEDENKWVYLGRVRTSIRRHEERNRSSYVN